jgi:hypothetical protein
MSESGTSRQFTALLSLPGLTPQVGFTRLAAHHIAQLGQARVAVQSITFAKKLLAKKMDARVKPAHDDAPPVLLPPERRLGSNADVLPSRANGTEPSSRRLRPVRHANASRRRKKNNPKSGLETRMAGNANARG